MTWENTRPPVFSVPDEVRVLDQADERIAAVGDVDPEVLGQRPLELEHEVERGEVLDRVEAAEVLVADLGREPGVEQLGEDVVGDAADDRLVGDRRRRRARTRRGSRPRRNESGCAGDDRERVAVAQQPRGRDGRSAPGRRRPRSAARARRTASSKLPVGQMKRSWRASPSRRLRRLPTLSQIQPIEISSARSPNLPRISGPQTRSQAASPMCARIHELAVWRSYSPIPRRAELQPQQRQPHPQARGGRERAEPQQVADAVEGPDATVDRERGARRVAAQQRRRARAARRRRSRSSRW